MILGFAHTTENRPVAPSWATHRDVPSAPEKWPLMARKATRHDLALTQWESEIVAYDTGVVDGRGRLSLSDEWGTIKVSARDASMEARFFCDGLGFQSKESGRLFLDSRIPTWRMLLDVAEDQDAPLDPPLDIMGRCALAFYTSDGERDRDQLLAAGGRDPTEPFTVKLDREMKIIMLRSPEGTIIELIQVKT